MKKALLITMLLGAILFIASTPFRTQPDKATELLEAQGYTNIDPGGYAWWGCSQDDYFQTEFTATSANGSMVSGVVCGGLFKGHTIRLD